MRRLPLDLGEISVLYSDIIAETDLVGIGTAQKIRITFKDRSYLDVWFSETGRYSYHWERRHVDGTMFRFDNAPHHPGISTFPHHCHNGNEEVVTESWLSPVPNQAVRQVLDFVRKKTK